MIDGLNALALGCLILLLHHLDSFEIDRRNFTQACFVQSYEVWFFFLHNFFLEGWSENVCSIWSLDIVQIMSSELLIVAISPGEVIEPWGDLQFLWIELIVKLLA